MSAGGRKFAPPRPARPPLSTSPDYLPLVVASVLGACATHLVVYSTTQE